MADFTNGFFSEPQKKVHRARKSIPNRHRAVSIESQLRARIEEQLPKVCILFCEGLNRSYEKIFLCICNVLALPCDYPIYCSVMLTINC